MDESFITAINRWGAKAHVQQILERKETLVLRRQKTLLSTAEALLMLVYLWNFGLINFTASTAVP
jgi:hypothetical protein